MPNNKLWVEKFYPVSARAVAEDYKAGKITKADLVQHSLTKWLGLLL